jgi:hypothetical protein
LTIALTLCGFLAGTARAAAGADRSASGSAAGAPGQVSRQFIPSKDDPWAAIVLVPSRTTVTELADAGFSPGLISPSVGTVPPDQTYLDITAGNRVFSSLYDDSALPPAPSLGRPRACQTWFREAQERAQSAPDEIVPGLLGYELNGHGYGFERSGRSACAFGGLGGSPGESTLGAVFVLELPLTQAARLGKQAVKDGRGLVIAMATPTGESGEPIPVGVAGRGYDGDLTSDSTRTDGYVLSTDIAPTLLERFGIAVPDEMTGQAIRTEGSIDPAGIESRGARMAVVSTRRGPVIGVSLLAWVIAAALVALLSRGALARPAVRLLGLSVVYLPATLLLGAAFEPSQYPEMLLVMIVAPLAAALTLATLRDYRALAVAAAVTIGAYALDAIAGSPLSALSLLGPNPGLGVRFYGIGNELEALLAVLIVGGIGAGLAGFAPRLSPGRCAATFLVVGLVLAGIFASGEFGADVGAAIDFPIGVAVAALIVTGGRRRWIFLVILVPLSVLALLALADLVTGANSHFTRSVLDAGGLHSLGDTAQRRLEQTGRSFFRPVLLVALPVVAILVLVVTLRRTTLAGWLRDAPAMRAAMIGAVVATVTATLANDSGALLLEIGAAYLLVFIGWAWAEAGRSARGA